MAQLRRRVKVSATINPELLDGVDAYLQQHPDADRSGIFDEALALWLAHQQDREMEEQFNGPGAPEDEVHDWRAIQRAAFSRALRRDGE